MSRQRALTTSPLLQRAQDIGLVGHIGAKNVGYDGSYSLNISSETYLLNLLRSLLSEHPDLYPGATRPLPCASKLRVRSNSHACCRWTARFRIETGIGVRKYASISKGSIQSVANFLAWKYRAEVTPLAVAGSIRFDHTHGGIIFVANANGMNDAKYVIPGTNTPNTAMNTEAFIVASGEEWRGGVSSLVQKHQAMITRDLTQDARRADKKRLAIEDLDATDPVNATSRARTATEAD